MLADVQIPKTHPDTATELGHGLPALTTSESVSLVFQPQLYPTLVMSLPSNDSVALKPDKRSDSIDIGHPSPSWPSLLDKDLVPRMGDALLVSSRITNCNGRRRPSAVGCALAGSRAISINEINCLNSNPFFPTTR
jgi:hypothetical protein